MTGETLAAMHAGDRARAERVVEPALLAGVVTPDGPELYVVVLERASTAA
jgi:hypothetical protein